MVISSPAQGIDDVDTRTDVIGHQPAEVATLLLAIADAAAGFVDQLDALRGRYPTQGLHGADPLAVLLDQAAAAANDLHGSAASAADTVGGRSLTNGLHPGQGPGGRNHGA